MRKLLVLMMVLVAVASFATGTQDSTKTVTVGIWGADRPINPDYPDGPQFYKDFVLAGYDVDIEWLSPGDGAAQPVDLMVMSGTQPDVYLDYSGRINKYANSKYAVDLTNLVDTSIYQQSFLDLFTHDGGLYALPETAWAQLMVVNKTLLDRVGMGGAIQNGQWSMAGFMEASRRVYALGPDYYGFVMFGATTAGDYWNLGFIPGFGAKLFDNGKVALDSPQGIEALTWYKDYPYGMKGPAGLDYSAMMTAFRSGKVLAEGGSSSGLGIGKESYDAGIVKEPFETVLTTYPRVDGVTLVGLSLGPDAAMLFKGGEAGLPVLLALTGEKSQRYRVEHEGRFSSLKALSALISNAGQQQVSDLIAANGLFDLGLSLTEYTEVRGMIPPMFQAIWTGELSVQDAVQRFATEANEALK